MDIIDVKTIVGFGVTNMDVYRHEGDEAIPLTAVRAGYNEIWRLVDERKISQGEKYSCQTVAEFDLFRRHFEDQFDGQRVVSTPGGSIFNTFCGIGASLCGLEPTLVSYIGNGQAAPQIRAICGENRVNLIEVPLPTGYEGSHNIPRNLVVQPLEGGERILIKGPSEVVKHAFAAYGQPDWVISRSDAFFVQGASIMRLGMDFLETKIGHLKWNPDKFVVFSVPTVTAYDADFLERKDGAKSKVERLRDFAADHVSLLSGTKEEFMALFGSDFEAGLRDLQAGWADAPRQGRHNPRLALITDGGKGAVLVTEGRGAEFIPARKDIQVAHKVGAGDATLAGFLAGLKAGMLPRHAAELAMDFGAIKVAQKKKTSTIEGLFEGLAQLGGQAGQEFIRRAARNVGTIHQPAPVTGAAVA